jgi:hydrogenase maturation protease
VVGIGNPYRGDDGIGPAVLARLRPDREPWVRLVDSDGEASRLVLAWDGARLAVVVDAVRSGAAPGTLHRLDLDPRAPDAPERLGRAGGWRAGTHGTGPAEALGLGRVTGHLPDRLVVVGVEVADTRPGPYLSTAVAGVVDDAVALVRAELARCGPPR